jgi:hypothetical protein
MPRKTNPEKDITISPVSAGTARLRRAATRPQHSATAAEVPATPAREPETPARTEAVVSERELSREEIARLAYSLWEARGCQGGNPDEDWLRAEEQLRQRALTTT